MDDATIEELGAKILRALADALDGEAHKNGAPTLHETEAGKFPWDSKAEAERLREQVAELRANLGIVQRNFDTAIGQRDAARDRAHDAESALAAERGGRPVTVERTARLLAERDRDDLLAAAREVLTGDLGAYAEVAALERVIERVGAG